MKKRNLAILLIIPFLVAIFGIVTINTAFNLVDNDVVRIEWDYRQNELFNLDAGRSQLHARGILADPTGLGSAGSRLVWSVRNMTDDDADPHAEIDCPDNINSYLIPLSTGWVTVSCSTEKGNIPPMQMNAYIYSGNAFVINTKTDGSAQNIDSTLYYGQYDRDPASGAKIAAEIPFDITVSDDGLLPSIVWDSQNSTKNVYVDIKNGDGVIHINSALGNQDTVVAFGCNDNSSLQATFNFRVVENGINVYNYDDLLACTNKSEEGEIAVLRKHFESLDNYNGASASNIAMFGKPYGDGFDFSDDVYRFETTFNHEYIDRWNEWVQLPENSAYRPVSADIIAGLRVQKDFYGNGYRLNLHNLCYPSQHRQTTDSNDNVYDVAVLGPNDLFRGPKPFYLLGDPNSTAPLVTAFGQDNVGVYLDGDNILFHDVKVSNGDFGLVAANLNYTGTVLEVHGNNDTVSCCVLQNGKNVVRSFSSNSLVIDRCILSTSRNFLLEVGSNNYVKNDPASSATHNFTRLDGSTYTGTAANYLTPSDEVLGDQILGLFVSGYGSINDILEPPETPKYDPQTQKEQMKASLHSIQQGLNCEDRLGGSTPFDGTTTVKDSIFYRSGIAGIGVNNLFNGPFLFNQSPSLISGVLGLFGSLLDAVVPMFPDNVSGASLPVSVELTGNTLFYDYKTLADWDIAGLIDQHIGDLVAGLGIGSFDVTIDDIFPLKEILTGVARRAGLTYMSKVTDDNGNTTDTEYISIPVAYYGGGRNLSKVSAQGLDHNVLSADYDVDLLDSYLNLTRTLDLSGLAGSGSLDDVLSNAGLVGYMKEVLTKTVITVTGFEPFRFQFETSAEGLFDQNGKPIAPNYRDLIH